MDNIVEKHISLRSVTSSDGHFIFSDVSFLEYEALCIEISNIIFKLFEEPIDYRLVSVKFFYDYFKSVSVTADWFHYLYPYIVMDKIIKHYLETNPDTIQDKIREIEISVYNNMSFMKDDATIGYQFLTLQSLMTVDVEGPPCPNCKSRRTVSIGSKQLRSNDEGSDMGYTCYSCGKAFLSRN
jgi:DNA-directed RNA polymerase subunit M/transcription elongation factor TFIIS